MAYYLRALLSEWEPRPPQDLISYSEAYGLPLRVEQPAEGAMDDPNWRQAVVLGPKSSAPVEIEITLDEGTPDCLLRQEVDEFLEELEDARASRRARKKVAAHIERTKAIVAVSVPASDYEAGLDAAATVISYFAERPGVLVHADAEGFYEGDRLLVATE